MTNEVVAAAPVVAGRFRPESVSHFKEVAKNMAWLLERSVQKCQEDLARIYGYSGLHELQQVLKQPGTSGPFAPRYSCPPDEEGLVEELDRRIFFVLFGLHKGYWREDHLASDRCFLVFEMGLFQEAAEHRACFQKIKQLLTYEVMFDEWPLIHGWPLGLKSWLASRYTEPMDMAPGWQKKLPQSKIGAGMARADIGWQSRMTGRVRLATMFKCLAPRVAGRKPKEMSRVPFREFEDEGGGVTEPAWEAYYLVDWLTEKKSKGSGTASPIRKDLIEAFVQRPSLATAAACEFVKDLKDPVSFRDRWAFECFKAALERYDDPSKALFSSSLDDGAIQSLHLHMGWESAELSESSRCQLWQLNCTRTEVIKSEKVGASPMLQPVIHANGSLIVPYNQDLVVMHPDGWHLLHDASEFASESAALAFTDIYLPAIGVKRLDFTYLDDYSIVEIDELLLASSVTIEALRSYFVRLLEAFDDNNCLPDSYGLWCQTLSLVYEDDGENNERVEDFAYADNVHAPSVLLINVDGCGVTFVQATNRRGKPVSVLRRNSRKTTPAGEALASTVMAAVKGLAVDVVVYDGGLSSYDSMQEFIKAASAKQVLK
jgi:hypothetical protein